MNKIKWENYFDAIWCIDYKPNVVRHDLITKELDRVGILDHPHFKFHETFPSIYYTYLYKKMCDDKLINTAFVFSEKVLNASFAHYSCIKKSNYDKYKHILIIENDARFLKDLVLIEDILNNMPADYDIILFDYFIHCSDQEFETYKLTKTNNYYYKYKNLASTCCYALSEKALLLYEKLYEQVIFPPDVYNSKFGFSDSLNKYFTLKNLACQVTFSNALNLEFGDKDSLHKTYLHSKLNYDDYNMNNGKPYAFGDVILG